MPTHWPISLKQGPPAHSSRELSRCTTALVAYTTLHSSLAATGRSSRQLVIAPCSGDSRPHSMMLGSFPCMRSAAPELPGLMAASIWMPSSSVAPCE